MELPVFFLKWCIDWFGVGVPLRRMSST
jgi:hypothetical protein